MKRTSRIFAALLLSAGIAISLTGCKEETIIRANLDPSGIETNVINDTLTIWTKTVYDDSIITSGTASNSAIVHGLGTVNDKFFGRTNAGIYFQLLPPKPNSPLSANPYTVDSAFVVLPIISHLWGDTVETAPTQNFNVYRVTEDMPMDSNYYSFTKKAYDNTPVGSIANVNFYRTKKDSVSVLGTNKPTHLRIPLAQSFAQALDDAGKASADNSAFLTSIKGLYIAPQDTGNTVARTLAYFLMNGNSDYNRAAVQVFYHEDDSTEKIAFFNYVPSTCSHYNRISRNYTGSQAAQYFNSTAKSDDVILLENEPGAAIDIRIPYLKALPEGIINVAQLIVCKVALPGDADNAFESASRIVPVGVDAGGGLYNIPDWGTSDEVQTFLDGYPKTLDLGGGLSTITYTLNIPRTIQNAIVNKSDELHLRINGSRNYYAGSRLTAGGRTYSNPPYRVRMNITYSKLK